MIDWNSKTKMPYIYDGINRTFVKVICDQCGKERWATVTNARQLESPGHLCVQCRSENFNKQRSKYSSVPGMIRLNRTALIPSACPECGKIRNTRPTAINNLCYSCAARKRQKIGITDIDGKTCPGCNIYKPFQKFTKNRSNFDGYSVYCIVCTRNKNDLRGRPRRYAGLSRKEWKDLCEKYGNKCLACGSTIAKLEADHIVPVACGGQNILDNIQPLCHACNARKGIQTIDYR